MARTLSFLIMFYGIGMILAGVYRNNIHLIVGGLVIHIVGHFIVGMIDLREKKK